MIFLLLTKTIQMYNLVIRMKYFRMYLYSQNTLSNVPSDQFAGPRSSCITQKVLKVSTPNLECSSWQDAVAGQGA